MIHSVIQYWFYRIIWAFSGIHLVESLGNSCNISLILIHIFFTVSPPTLIYLILVMHFKIGPESICQNGLWLQTDLQEKKILLTDLMRCYLLCDAIYLHAMKTFSSLLPHMKPVLKGQIIFLIAGNATLKCIETHYKVVDNQPCLENRMLTISTS